MNTHHLNCFNIDASGFHSITYHEYGAQNSHVILCVHGLSRNSSDFHFLALDLAKNGFRVVTVDVVGRGQSDRVPAHLYAYKQYLSDLYELLLSLNISTFDLIGTSMGGILGLMLGSLLNQKSSNPTSLISQTDQNEKNVIFRRLVMVDIGAKISSAGLSAIANLHLERVEFGSLEEIEAEFRQRISQYGYVSPENWEYMKTYSLFHNKIATGTLKENHYYFRYDPNILGAKPADQTPTGPTTTSGPTSPVPVADFELWNFWESLKLPSAKFQSEQVNPKGAVLLIHGKNSVLLTDEIVNEMQKRKPSSLELQYVCFEDCGHCPSLAVEPHIQAILNFLK